MWKVKRMNTARLIVLGVAVVAGGLAALLAGRLNRTEAPPPAPVAKIDTTGVLVARSDIGIGRTVTPDDFEWQPWPSSIASNVFIRRSDRPDAITQLAGSIARAPIAAGEPVRENKLIKANGSGYMAAILPAGMRAVSTEISPETGAGGFILPNDRVDVILTRRDRDTEHITGVEAHVSETILSDVRVLAIDQTVEDKDGQKVVVGKTATLELTQRQAETLALARKMGTLSLALRSLADANKGGRTEVADSDTSRVNMVRFGVTSTTLTK
jgi:pilus assembly protein CpaB